MKIALLANGDIGVLFAKLIMHLVSISIFVFEDKAYKLIPSENMLKSVLVYNHKMHSTYCFLDEYDFDFIISYNWNHKIPQNALKQWKFLNFHQSLLPKHRGPILLVFSILVKRKQYWCYDTYDESKL